VAVQKDARATLRALVGLVLREGHRHRLRSSGTVPAPILSRALAAAETCATRTDRIGEAVTKEWRNPAVPAWFCGSAQRPCSIVTHLATRGMGLMAPTIDLFGHNGTRDDCNGCDQ